MSLDPNRTQPERYDSITIAHHWIVAFLVAGLWIAGQTIGYLPKGPFRSSLWQTHVLVGFVLAAVLLSRVAWKFLGGRRLPGIGTPAIRNLAIAVHFCLYLLLFVVVALGIANAFNRGVDMYGILKLPQIGDKDLKKPLTEALLHHYVWKDTTLARMRPERA